MACSDYYSCLLNEWITEHQMQKAQGTSRCPGEYLNPSGASEWFGRDDPRPRPRGRATSGRDPQNEACVAGSWAVMRSMAGRVRTGALTAYEVSQNYPKGTDLVEPCSAP